MAAIAYFILQKLIIASQGSDSLPQKAFDKDGKGKTSVVIHAAAIGLAFLSQNISVTLYAIAALMWLLSDKRIEQPFAQIPDQSRYTDRLLRNQSSY